MDAYRALPRFSETLDAMIRKGHAVLATVVASYPGAVDARMSDGTIARFPSTVSGLPVGHTGALIATADGGKLFIASNMSIPSRPKHDPSSTISIPVSTAGETYVSAAEVTFTGLIPGATYTVDGTADLRAGSSGRVWAFVYAVGAATVISPGIPATLHGAETAMSASGVIDVVASDTGTISVYPGYDWSSGSFTITRAGIRASIMLV